MRVTSVTVTLSAEDIMVDLKTLVESKVPELNFKEVILEDNYIQIAGTFRKVITIPFLARIRIVSVFNNIMTIKIEKIKVLKIGIPKFILNIAAKTAAKKAADLGIGYENKALSVNIDEVLQKVPHVHLEVEHFIMENGILSLRIKGIEADIDALQAESNKDEEEEKRKKQEEAEIKLREFNEKLAAMETTKDSYSDFRGKLMNKVPYNRQNLAKYAFILPDMYALALRLMKDKRVTKRDKALIAFTFGYPLVPADIIPSKTPVIGQLDDIAILFFGSNYILNKIPVPILVKHWQGDLKTLKLIMDNIEKIVAFTPARTLTKVYDLVDENLEKRHKSYLTDEAYLFPESDIEPLDLNPIFEPVLEVKVKEIPVLEKNQPGIDNK
ncbi:MAG: DUF1232 domain-containing protein [Clostridium sp.]|nr:DUF1232 domain-containing protein [Clostridium sp.]